MGSEIPQRGIVDIFMGIGESGDGSYRRGKEQQRDRLIDLLRGVKRDPHHALGFRDAVWNVVVDGEFIPVAEWNQIPTPIHDGLIECFSTARRSTRTGGRCFWIDAEPGMQKCLACGDIDIDMGYEE